MTGDEKELNLLFILGISAFYHDSAAAILRNGKLVAAAQEERFTRKKHDSEFPFRAIGYCLQEAGISLDGVDCVVFYDKPLLKFERIIETYFGSAPRGFESFCAAIPVWIKEKIFLKQLLKKNLRQFARQGSDRIPQLLFTTHHQSHAASAFFPSPFERAAVLCLDGVGEWVTTSLWSGKGNELSPQWELRFPHSLGLLYSAFTYYTGFKVNSGEYKVMGLAPYGQPKYVQQIMDNLIDLKDDGTFRLNMDYFNYTVGLTMTNDKFAALFGGPPRQPETLLTQKEMDLARSVQEVTEEIVLRLCRTIHKEQQEENLCLAGGVALNCVANGKVLRENLFKDIWIQPAAGDAGGAVGAAYSAWYEYYQKPRTVNPQDSMEGAYLGPSYGPQEIRQYLDGVGAVYRELPEEELIASVAELIDQGNVIGWFQGRMEFGPRALGARSIIGDPRNPEMQTTMNLKIKFRESFRPFAPSVLGEAIGSQFEMEHASPYMLLVAPVKEEHRIATSNTEHLFGIDLLKIKRSTIPAITHVDYSARIQTVHEQTNARYHKLISEFYRLTGCPLVVNTSFNVRGEPIVCSPGDAYKCFMRTAIDYLVVENFVLKKDEQPVFDEDESWKKEYVLD